MDINAYARQLSPAEIDAKEHRALVGGMWEEIGALQFEFLKGRGLVPSHRLLDLGCGALRGGLHFIRYLDAGNYYGLDVNASLIDAGKRELHEAGLADRQPHLLVNAQFELDRFATAFDHALAVSVFSHLPMNHIIACLVRTRQVLRPGARLYASYFEAPAKAWLAPLAHPPGDMVSNYSSDAYHYAFEEMQWMADTAQLNVERVGEWGHPRGQMMLAFASRDA
jgi:cyclopropane fatty-acyl-phospholipid synthase-like methyltransferase